MASNLIHAPARLSDLPLDERKAAMMERDNARRAAYLASLQQPRPLLARLVDWFRG